jgi:outer membrane beta-barrel protein
MLRRPAYALCTVAALGSAAAAQTHEPLADQPEVRHRIELRASRFEITPTFEASISAYFKHTIAGGLKLEYHINDYLSIGGMVFYGGSFNTGLLDQVIDSLPPAGQEMYPTPSQDVARQHANTIPLHGGAGLTFTPFAGKLAFFSRAFLAYDVYLSAGFGFAKTQNDFKETLPDGTVVGDSDTICDAKCDDPVAANHVFNDPRNDGPHNAGFQPGVQFGGGLHLFFSEVVALDLYVRDYMFTDNPSGLDYNYDYKVDDSDRRFLSHLFFGAGLALFLPPKAKISR